MAGTMPVGSSHYSCHNSILQILQNKEQVTDKCTTNTVYNIITNKQVKTYACIWQKT